MNSSSTESDLTDPAPRGRTGSSALPPAAKPGRPSSFSMEKVHAICALIRERGLSECAAGEQVGVPHTTLSRWKARYEEVAMELEKARTLYELPRLRQIAQTRRKDGSLDWRAQAWLLKFSAPEHYGPPSRRRRLRDVAISDEDRQVAVNDDLAGSTQGAAAKCVTFSPEITVEDPTSPPREVDGANNVTLSPETSSEGETNSTNSVTISPEIPCARETHLNAGESPAGPVPSVSRPRYRMAYDAGDRGSRFAPRHGHARRTRFGILHLRGA